MAIQQDVRQSWHETIIELFELDLSPVTKDSSDVFYFTNDIFSDGTKPAWKGKVYEPFPIAITGFETSTNGPIPQPELTVANVLGTLAAATNALDDLVGAKLTRRRTLGKYLDNGTSPNQLEEFPKDIYYIERKTSETNLTITWQLASKIDLEGLQLPRRVVTQNYCVWEYRGPECGYAGPPVATVRDGRLSGSGSTASNNYIKAFNDFNAAVSAERQAVANRNLLEGKAIAACRPSSFPIKKTFSQLKNEPYSFGLKDSGQDLFAAVQGNAVNIGEGSDYLLTRTVNTGFGKDNNKTGPVHTIVQTDSNNKIIASFYSATPPLSFAFQLRDDAESFVGIVNGSLVSVVESGAGFQKGERRDSNIAEVTAVGEIDKAGIVCDEVQADFATAQADYAAAVQARQSAESALNAALAALPTSDALFRQDVCGKRLSSCKLRFGARDLPYGAFPGANLSR
jgi:lambda family phage minor tail protein L